jgi:hypothetical protein
MKTALRTLTIFVLWGLIGVIGLIISMVYNLYWGGAFVSVCYLIWLELEKKIEAWWESIE